MQLTGCSDTTNPVTDTSSTGFVIETPVNGAEDCLDIEKFDASQNVCYVECETEAECVAIEKKLDLALEGLDTEYSNAVQNLKPISSTVVADSQVAGAEAVYQIKKGENFTLISGNEKPDHQQIKDWLAAISPDDFSDSYLAYLYLLPDSDDNAAAYVAASTQGEPGTWDVYVNMKSLREDGEKEMVFTLIHEYTHVLTLNTSQLDTAIPQGECQTYYPGEGCTKEDSYLNRYFQKFWASIFDPALTDYQFWYQQHPDDFVTPYAATNPVEDIAESFPSFVFREQSEPTTVADQKRSFFYAYPELVQTRSSIRTVLKRFVRDTVVQ